MNCSDDARIASRLYQLATGGSECLLLIHSTCYFPSIAYVTDTISGSASVWIW